MVEEGLVTKLTADVPEVGGRIFPQYLPQGAALPAISYRLVSDPMLDASDGPTGLVPGTYVLTSWAETYAEMKAVAQKVRQSLAGFTGVLGSEQVARIAWLGGPETFDNNAPRPGDEVPGVHRQDATVEVARTGVT